MKSFILFSKISLIEELLKLIGLEETQSSFKAGSIVLSIAIILMAGFLLTRLTKLLKLPNVTAYVIAGVLIGPYCFNIIPESITNGMSFISDVALALISFSVGEFLKLSSLKKAGFKAVIITIFESLLTFFTSLFVLTCLIKVKLEFSILLSSIITSTAATSTLMIIRNTNSKGDFVNTLLEVIALDNVITLFLYSISISVSKALLDPNIDLKLFSVLSPLLNNLLSIVIGFLFGLILRLFISRKRTTDNRLIIVLSVLIFYSAISLFLNVSPLLGCMAIGMVYTNTMEKDDKLFKQVNYFSPPIMLIFFVRSGLTLNLSIFLNKSSIIDISLILFIFIYIVLKMITKYFGAYLGSLVTKEKKEIKYYLGLSLISQSSVAIGLASLSERSLSDIGFSQYGNDIMTITIISSIILEFIGPVLSKLALQLSNKDEVEEPVVLTNSVDNLIKEINDIQKTISVVNTDENENAFNELIEEEENYYNQMRINHRFNNRR